MAIQYPLKYTKVSGAATGLQEFEAGDQITADLVNGLMGKNLFINGNFDFWRRGILTKSYSNTTFDEYIADRWRVGGVTASATVSRQNCSLGDPNSAKYFLRYNLTAVTAGGAAYLGQRIEDVSTSAGETITVSFWAYTGATGRKIGVRAIQSFGTGGSPSASVGTEAGTVTLTTGWVRYSVNINVPSVSGKTRGTNGDDYLYIVLDFCGTGYSGAILNQTGDFNIIGVQVESGSVATAFGHRPDALEWLLCARYYESSYADGTAPGTSAQHGRRGGGWSGGTAGSNYRSESYAVQKRTVPAIAIYNPSSGANGSAADAAGNSVGVTIVYSTVNNFELQWANSAGNWGGWFHFTADAEL